MDVAPTVRRSQVTHEQVGKERPDDAGGYGNPNGEAGMWNEEQSDEPEPWSAQEESNQTDEPRVQRPTRFGLAGMAVFAKEPSHEDEGSDRSQADQDQDHWGMVWRCVEPWPRLLGPPVPGDAATDKERDACGDDAALAEPGLVAAIGKEEFRDLDRNEDDCHAFKAEHEEEVKPVDSRVAAVARIRSGKRERCDRCLLDDELFGDGESEAEHQQAGCAAAPAANQLAAEESAAAPDHHFGNEHEEDAEARRSAEDLGDEGRKNEQASRWRPCSAAQNLILLRGSGSRTLVA